MKSDRNHNGSGRIIFLSQSSSAHEKYGVVEKKRSGYLQKMLEKKIILVVFLKQMCHNMYHERYFLKRYAYE